MSSPSPLLPGVRELHHDTNQPAPAARAAQGRRTARETFENETDLRKTGSDCVRKPCYSGSLHCEFASLFLDIKKVDATVPTAQSVGFLLVGEILCIPRKLWDTVVNVGTAVGLQSKHFRTINVQWIGQWGRFSPSGSS